MGAAPGPSTNKAVGLVPGAALIRPAEL